MGESHAFRWSREADLLTEADSILDQLPRPTIPRFSYTSIERSPSHSGTRLVRERVYLRQKV